MQIMIINKKTIKFIHITTFVIKVDNLNLIHKRTMMAANTKLTLSEATQQKKLLSLLLQRLRENPLNQDKLLSLIEISPINVKLFQNMVTVIFPKANFSLEMVQQKYPGINLGLRNTTELSWNDVIAAHIAFTVKNHGTFPPDSKLYVQGTPPYDPIKGDTSNNLQAIANTGQKNPDYFLVHKEWSRYYDFKSGQYSHMKGHIVVRNTDEAFEQTIKEIMYNQLQFFMAKGDPYIDVAVFIKGLINDKTLDWVQRSKNLQAYYFSIMQRLPPETPSMAFVYKPAYEHENMSYKYYNNIPIKEDSCKNEDGIYTVLTEIFGSDKSGKLFSNYKESHGVSPTFLKMKNKFILEMLGEFAP